MPLYLTAIAALSLGHAHRKLQARALSRTRGDSIHSTTHSTMQRVRARQG